ncbi:MAG TPA: endonuclease domain-containing protein [Thermoanaerobaculaceae bacterium]|nr:endonuclease domain-containing protein [Thermoanaerobaculaceae bacterium]HPS76579.1 endonuclease domain-containing protein [Thermoanaerobaculaceae bacterium]
MIMNITDPLNPTKLPIEDVVKILELYKTCSLRKVSAAVGRDIKTIQKILEANGVEARTTWTRKGASNDRMYAFDDRLVELKDRYDAGESIEAISTLLGVSPSTASKVLVRAGADLRNRGPKPSADFRPGEVCCGTCREWKPTSEYHYTSSGSVMSECKVCQRRRWLKNAYGITPEIYDAMMAAQNGGCAVCGCSADHARNSGGANSNKKAFLCVDHDHGTLAVRGLLCSQCNQALGHMEDNPGWISKLVDYVIKHQ